MKKWMDTYSIDYMQEGQCDLIDGSEFSEDGLLSRYYKKVQTDQYIDMKSLYKDVLLISELSSLINSFNE